MYLHLMRIDFCLSFMALFLAMAKKFTILSKSQIEFYLLCTNDLILDFHTFEASLSVSRIRQNTRYTNIKIWTTVFIFYFWRRKNYFKKTAGRLGTQTKVFFSACKPLSPISLLWGSNMSWARKTLVRIAVVRNRACHVSM